MKKTGILILSSLIVLGLLLSPVGAEDITEEWVGTFANSTTYSAWDFSRLYSKKIAVDDEGNAYVAGLTGSSNPILIKYDGDGARQWAHYYPGTSSGSFIHAVKTDADGHVYVTGSTSLDGTWDHFQMLTIKYDTDGNPIWSARYDGTEDGREEGFDLVIDDARNVYVTGISETADTGKDYITIKYDPSGNEVWRAVFDAGIVEGPYGPKRSDDYSYVISLDPSGNVYVAGETKWIPTSNPLQEYAVVKYDPDGNQLWAGTYPCGRTSILKTAAMAVDDQENVYLATYDFTLVNFDKNGTLLWSKKYDRMEEGFEAQESATAVAVGPSGDIYVTGRSSHYCQKHYPYCLYDFDTVKFDPAGNILWSAKYKDHDYSSADTPTAMTMDAEEHIYITGYSKGSGYPYNYDYATIKYDRDGNELWAVRYDGWNGQGSWGAGDYAHAIAVDKRGAVYVTGESMLPGATRAFVTVKYARPNDPPAADAGRDQTVELGSCGGAAVTLDGSASYDPDGDPITYAWSWAGGNASGIHPVVTLPYGTTEITLTVTDDRGASDTDTVVIAVEDTIAPTLGVTLDPDILWPPNHKYVTVTPSFVADDACSDYVSVQLLSLTSNESDNGKGDGHTTDDFVVNDDGTLSLRAERSGSGDGRVYTATFIATDIAGNTTLTSATVTVPHDTR